MIAVGGYYTLVSMLLNAIKIPLALAGNLHND